MTAALTSNITPLGQGFLLCASIIIAFGPQNLFIFRQGLRRQHIFTIAVFSTLAELVMVGLAVGGLSALISTNDVFHTVITAGGGLFLTWYGIRSLLSAIHPRKVVQEAPHAVASGVKTAIAAALGFAFLNPASYVDTLVIIGSKSLLFADEQRWIFGIGAVLASATWFLILGYGASKLSTVFRSQMAWRVLDVVSGSIMLGIVATMVMAG